MKLGSRDRIRRAKTSVLQTRQAIVNTAYDAKNVLIPFQFDGTRYTPEFLHYEPNEYESLEVPRVIYCFWTGNNELSPNRKRSLDTLRAMNSDVSVQLVTAGNLTEYVEDGYPLHPAYEYLSLVHRADYLRCYFMTFRGGGYSDVKASRHPWLHGFEKLSLDSNAWALGYPEVKAAGVARVGGRLEEDLKSQYRRLIGNGAYIFRPRTPFALTWFREVNRRLDVYLPLLAGGVGGGLGRRCRIPHSLDGDSR